MKPYDALPPLPRHHLTGRIRGKLVIVKDDTGAISAYAHGRYGFRAGNPEVRCQQVRYYQFDTTAMVMTGKHWVS